MVITWDPRNDEVILNLHGKDHVLTVREARTLYALLGVELTFVDETIEERIAAHRQGRLA